MTGALWFLSGAVASAASLAWFCCLAVIHAEGEAELANREAGYLRHALKDALAARQTSGLKAYLNGLEMGRSIRKKPKPLQLVHVQLDEYPQSEIPS